MKSVLMLIISLSVASAGATESLLQRSYSNVQSLSLTSLQGKTEIRPSTTSDLTVEIQKKSFSDRCDLSLRQNGGNLEIEVSKGWIMSTGVQCQADIVLLVPENTRLQIYQATGELALNQLKNPVNVNSPSARVLLNEVSSQEVTIRATSGSVNLVYREVAPQRINISTISGSASYVSDSPTAVSFNSVSGSLVLGNGKSANQSATSRIDFSSVSGSFIWR